MKKQEHKIFVLVMALSVVAVFSVLAYYGAGFYATAIADRLVHEQYAMLKPSGTLGHGIGIAGSLIMVTGVFGYMIRKRVRRFSRIGYLRYWLEIHIFLCTLGSVLILFHTSFKFGGLVAISFWSMVAVLISGIIGRFIYLQIPRTLEGRELSLKELNMLENELYAKLKDQYQLSSEIILSFENIEPWNERRKSSSLIQFFRRLRLENSLSNKIKTGLARSLAKRDRKKVMQVVRRKITLNRRIEWLSSMQNYLRYWHVAHLPFALLMLLIMIVHVSVALIFGYRWIF